MIEVLTSENQHWYPSGTTYFPSVTTILSIWPKGYGFDKYLANSTSWESSQEILNKAGKRGTRVHEATQYLEMGLSLARSEYSLEEWEMLMGFCGWYKETNPQKIEVEYQVISKKLKTGGTIDRVYMIDGLLTVLDIKTSSTIHGNYWVQAATYAEMYEEHSKKQVDQIAILRVTDRKKSRYEFQTMDRISWKEEFKIFKSIHAVWKHLNPKASPKILEIPTTLKL